MSGLVMSTQNMHDMREQFADVRRDDPKLAPFFKLLNIPTKKHIKKLDNYENVLVNMCTIVGRVTPSWNAAGFVATMAFFSAENAKAVEETALTTLMISCGAVGSKIDGFLSPSTIVAVAITAVLILYKTPLSKIKAIFLSTAPAVVTLCMLVISAQTAARKAVEVNDLVYSFKEKNRQLSVEAAANAMSRSDTWQQMDQLNIRNGNIRSELYGARADLYECQRNIERLEYYPKIFEAIQEGVGSRISWLGEGIKETAEAQFLELGGSVKQTYYDRIAWLKQIYTDYWNQQ